MDSLELSNLTNASLQARIELCGLQMLAADQLGMKDERRRWMALQEAALRERHRRPLRAMEHSFA